MRTAKTLGTLDVLIVPFMSDFLLHALHGIDVNYVWFQWDGATSRTSHGKIDFLHQQFDVHLISKSGDVNCHQYAAIRLRWTIVCTNSH